MTRPNKWIVVLMAVAAFIMGIIASFVGLLTGVEITEYLGVEYVTQGMGADDVAGFVLIGLFYVPGGIAVVAFLVGRRLFGRLPKPELIALFFAAAAGFLVGIGVLLYVSA